MINDKGTAANNCDDIESVTRCSWNNGLCCVKHFPRYWAFVRGIHRFPINSPHKGQWRGALIFSLICAWTNDWVNHRDASDLRRHRAHYDVTVISYSIPATVCVFDQQFVFAIGSHRSSVPAVIRLGLPLLRLFWRQDCCFQFTDSIYGNNNHGVTRCRYHSGVWQQHIKRSF